MSRKEDGGSPRKTNTNPTSDPGESSSDASLDVKRRYRPLVSDNSIESSGNTPDSESWKALRKRISEGLPRARRPATITNQIEIFVPPSFAELPITHGSTPTSSGAAGHHVTTSAASPEEPQQRVSVSSDVTLIKQESSRVAQLSPPERLGASRSDPFATYPIRLGTEDQRLIDQSKPSQKDHSPHECNPSADL